MTTSALEMQNAPARPTGRRAPRRPAGRVATILVLIGSLLLSGLLRLVAADRQSQLVNLRGTPAARSTLGNMDSFALALLLGGLRGPLIMFLWPAIENQKADHDLKDVDTMIEWVRLLQPEFDSVHMFQIWNKAYNLSAMMASPANKYVVIMEAIDYAERVDRERPGDINILGAMSNVYGGKLGSTNLPEFSFYGKQFRQESMTDANRLAAYPEEQKRFQRLYTHGAPILDANNQIRPDLLAPTRGRPADVAPEAEWNDGSALQYLKAYGPFPYGMSPIAMSYNYAKRAEVAQSAEGQKPLQLSGMVIDSQPAIQLKFWEEDAARHARRYEARAFAVSPTGGVQQTEAALAAVPVDAKPVDRKAVDAALYFYQTAHRVSRDAINEYERHLAKPEYMLRRPTYRSHIEDMQAADVMNDADHAYLAAIVTADPAQRAVLLRSASDLYYKAMIRRERIALEFYTEDAALWAKGVMPVSDDSDPAHAQNKERVFRLDESLVSDVYNKAMKRAQGMPEHADDRMNYAISVDRCRERIGLIAKALR